MSPLFPASSPYILAVGGVTWTDDDPSKPTAWTAHEGCTGGGFSDAWPAPPFMAETVSQYFAHAGAALPPPAQYSASGRAYPDLAAFMDGVPLCFDGTCHASICGGTSASTPTMGGE